MITNSFPPTKKTFAKKFVIFFLSFIGFIVILFAALPSILSTSWGNKQIVNLINKKIPGNIEVKHLEINWLGPQQIKSMTLYDPEGQPLVSLGSANFEASLFGLLNDFIAAGDFQFKDLNANLSTDVTGTTNFERAINPNCCRPKAIEQGGLPAIRLSNVTGYTKKPTTSSPLVLIVNGTTQQGDSKGTISIDIKITGSIARALIDGEMPIDRLLESRDEDLEAKMIVDNFPTQIIDELIGIKNPDLAGIAVAIFGPQINMRLTEGAVHKADRNTLNFELSSPTAKTRLDFKLTDLHADATLKSIPIATIDKHLKLNGKLVEVLGDTVGATVTYNAGVKPHLGKLTLQSEKIKIDPISFSIDDIFKITSPTTIKWNLTPNWLKSALDLGPIKINDPVSVQVSVRSLSFPFKDPSEQLNLEAEISASPFKFSGIPKIGSTTLQDLVVKITNGDNHQILVEAASRLVQPAENLLSTLLGQTIKVAGTAAIDLSRHSSTLADNIALKVTGDKASLEMHGTLTKNQTLLLTHPTIVNYTLTAAVLNAFGLSTEKMGGIEPTPLVITFGDSTIPLNEQNLEDLALKGQLSLKNLNLYQPEARTSQKASLENIKVSWNIDGSTPQIKFTVTGDARLEKEASSKFTVDMYVEDWLKNNLLNWEDAKLQLSLSFNNLPSKFLNLFSKDIDSELIFGPAITVNGSAIYSLDKNIGDLGVNIRSKNLTGSIAFSYADGLLKLVNNPDGSQIVYNLTPTGYRELQNLFGEDQDFNLSDSALISLRLNQFKLPVSKGILASDLMRSSFDIDLSIDKFSGTSGRTNEKVFFNNIRSHLASTNPKERVSFDIHAKGVTGQGIPSSCNGVGVLENAFADNGSLDKKRLSMSLDAVIESFPITLICQFACLDNLTRNRIEAVVGKTLDAKIKTKLHQLNGMVYFDAKGKNGHLLIDGTVNNGILTLNQDLNAELIVTEQLSTSLLEGIIPILDGLFAAEQPITLKVDKKGFALPLNDLAIPYINMPNAVFNLGKVQFTPDSEIAKVLGLLVGESKGQVVVWMTPLYFSLVNGSVNISRVDLLINDKFPIAAWGNVDIAGNNVDMVIGLTGAAISKAFKVPGLPNRYILQLPLRGTLNHASIDRTKAAARLSALVAQAQGGPQGLVLGTFLHIASGGLSESPVPNPTTQPLPWAYMLEDPPESESVVKDIAGKPVNDTLNQIKKGAGNLFKQILK